MSTGRTAYAVDAATTGSGSFEWESTWASKLGIQRKDLTVVVWSEEGGQQVYLPVRWADSGNCKTEDPELYHLSFRNTRGSHATIKVTPLTAPDRNPVSFEQRGDFEQSVSQIRLGMKRFAAGAGVYQVQINFKDGRDTTVFLRHTP
jgi:hypothetical protein